MVCCLLEEVGRHLPFLMLRGKNRIKQNLVHFMGEGRGWELKREVWEVGLSHYRYFVKSMFCIFS